MMVIKSFSGPTKGGKKKAKKLLMTTLLVAVLATMFVGVAHANVRMTITPALFPPQYLDFIPDSEWVAFIFYRPPICVPDDFNIFSFFDIPDAFFCLPLTVEGFAIYKNPYDPPFQPPKQAKLTGLGEVPVWFISRDDYDDARSDGKLLFEEVKDSPSLLKGEASFYKETRHISGVHPVPKINIVARGTVEDSTVYETFWFHAMYLPNQNNYNANIVLE